MKTSLPTLAEIKASLRRLTMAQMIELSRLSETPYPTLRKVRYGGTTNPGIETIRKFIPHIATARRFRPPLPSTQPTDTTAAIL